MTSSNTPPLDLRRNNRRRFAVWGLFQFRVPAHYQDACLTFLTTVTDCFVYLLGPVLICFAMAIIGCLSYSFFNVMLPMLLHKHKDSTFGSIVVACHVIYVVFVLINVMFNYALCVMTRNKGPNYDRVVRELAHVTGYNYPETPDQVDSARRDYEEKMFFYTQRRRAREKRSSTNGTSTVTQRQNALASTESNSNTNTNAASSINSGGGGERVHNWTLMGPDEWGFCRWSNQPKPPRSHYDHVTKCLVLNMDHYCPWMFNTIGYFNYRYFCNFLFFVFVGMGYGAMVSLTPFLATTGNRKQYLAQLQHNRGKEVLERIYPMVPHPGERTALSFSFLMCIAVGFAVLCLAGFHLYLILSAQTTIEFHGNVEMKRRARRQKQKWVNPYDFGNKRNWQQVYGRSHPLIALLPSRREPEFLPVPFPGESGLRRALSKQSHESNHEVDPLLPTTTTTTSSLAEVV